MKTPLRVVAVRQVPLDAAHEAAYWRAWGLLLTEDPTPPADNPPGETPDQETVE